MAEAVAPRHLLTYKTISGGTRDTVVAYFLTPKQLTREWDGVAALRVPFAKLTANALNDAARRGARPAAVKEMRLSAQRLGGRWYYFWAVDVCHEGDEYRSQTTEVLLDLAGEVIEREETHFDEPNWKKRTKASQAYAASLSSGG
jgi:hypothetical protein